MESITRPPIPAQHISAAGKVNPVQLIDSFGTCTFNFFLLLVTIWQPPGCICPTSRSEAFNRSSLWSSWEQKFSLSYYPLITRYLDPLCNSYHPSHFPCSLFSPCLATSLKHLQLPDQCVILLWNWPINIIIENIFETSKNVHKGMAGLFDDCIPFWALSPCTNLYKRVWSTLCGSGQSEPTNLESPIPQLVEV